MEAEVDINRERDGVCKPFRLYYDPIKQNIKRKIFFLPNPFLR